MRRSSSPVIPEHFSVRQRSPFRKSFMPSRRQSLHLGPMERATLDPPPLLRPHAVVGLRRDVADAEDLEPGRLERADRGLAPGARALDEDLDLLEPVLHALARARVGRHLGGKGGGLTRALETGRAGALPRDDVPFLVGQGDDRVVEGRLDVRLADGDVLLDPAARAALRLTAGGGHYLAFFPRPTVFFGPLRVRAFVFVRWPLTGRPRRWRKPRYAPISCRRLIACERSRRRSPSTWRFESMKFRSLVISASVRSRIFSSAESPSSAQM